MGLLSFVAKDLSSSLCGINNVNPADQEHLLPDNRWKKDENSSRLTRTERKTLVGQDTVTAADLIHDPILNT